MGATIICDGGCGAQSPNPTTGLHEANSWLRVRASFRWPFERASEHNDKLFCKACAPRILDGLKSGAFSKQNASTGAGEEIVSLLRDILAVPGAIPVELHARIEAAVAAPPPRLKERRETSLARRLWSCALAALLALFVAKGLGVPFWRDGWGLEVIGDQADFMLVAVLLVWSLTTNREAA